MHFAKNNPAKSQLLTFSPRKISSFLKRSFLCCFRRPSAGESELSKSRETAWEAVLDSWLLHHACGLTGLSRRRWAENTIIGRAKCAVSFQVAGKNNTADDKTSVSWQKKSHCKTFNLFFSQIITVEISVGCSEKQRSAFIHIMKYI
jgi:hypothetical protein